MPLLIPKVDGNYFFFVDLVGAGLPRISTIAVAIASRGAVESRAVLWVIVGEDCECEIFAAQRGGVTGEGMNVFEAASLCLNKPGCASILDGSSSVPSTPAIGSVSGKKIRAPGLMLDVFEQRDGGAGE